MTVQAPTKPATLLDPAFMARLDQLDVMSRKLLAGKMKGERRSKRRGQSVEFADYRNYVVGDDLRFIDWNIYARLDKLFLKLFLEEEDLALYVLLDVSKSCDFGNPNKAFYIKQVAAALGYIGLVNYNRVSVVAMADGVVAETGAMRGRRRVAQMIDFVQKLEPSGASHFTDSCRRFALQHRQKGVCVVLSDFFIKEGFETGLRYVAGGKYDLFCVQVLSPQEIDPDLQGDLKLRDIEDDDMAEVSITQPLVKQYKANLNAYCLALKDFVTRRGGTYLFTSTAVPFDTLVLNYLRERGLLGWAIFGTEFSIQNPPLGYNSSMRTSGRWLARLSIITSALLCIGVCLLWLRSDRTIDSIAVVPRPTSIDQPEVHVTAWEVDSFSGRLRLLAIQMQGPWPRLPWRESGNFHAAWPIGSPEHRALLNVIQGNLLQVHREHYGITYEAGLSWGFAYFPVRIVTLPLWMPATLFAIGPALWLARRVFKRRPRRGHCSFCRYNLTGNTSGICPECGRRISEL